jgi:hypothetical protein
MSDAPTLFLGKVTDSSITFGWNFGTTPDHFQVTRNSPNYKVLIPTTGPGSPDWKVNEYTDTGLNSGTDYGYAVTCFFGTQSVPGSGTYRTTGNPPSSGSSMGSPVNKTTPVVAYPAKPVTNLTAVAATYKTIYVSWTNPGDGSQLQLYRFNPSGAFYMVYEANDPASNYLDNQGGLYPGLTYRYEVWTGLQGDAYFTKVASNPVTMPPFDLRQYLYFHGGDTAHGYDFKKNNLTVTSLRAYAGI